MGTVHGSLRLLVEKWFGSTPTMPVRVTRFGRLPSTRRRYVCVEIFRPTGTLAIYFFLHDDGTWWVFPPEIKRPAMGVSRRAA
jgi:hypothetical protein